jgi:hypothetical protein
MGHGLDDVVQWFMLPVGDRGTGRIQSHAKRCGPEHTGHLLIGRTPIGDRQVAPAPLGRDWQILRRIVRDRLI